MQAPNAEAAAAAEQHRIHRGTPGLRRRAAEGRPGRSYVPRFPLRRSNVETSFSMIKRVIGDTLRSKTRVAQINEALLMIVCHNIRCLIHEMYELGINPAF